MVNNSGFRKAISDHNALSLMALDLLFYLNRQTHCDGGGFSTKILMATKIIERRQIVFFSIMSGFRYFNL